MHKIGILKPYIVVKDLTGNQKTNYRFQTDSYSSSNNPRACQLIYRLANDITSENHVFTEDLIQEMLLEFDRLIQKLPNKPSYLYIKWLKQFAWRYLKRGKSIDSYKRFKNNDDINIYDESDETKEERLYQILSVNNWPDFFSENDFSVIEVNLEPNEKEMFRLFCNGASKAEIMNKMNLTIRRYRTLINRLRLAILPVLGDKIKKPVKTHFDIKTYKQKTEDKKQQFLTLIKKGYTFSDACRKLQLHNSTYRVWKKRDKSFFEELEKIKNASAQ